MKCSCYFIAHKGFWVMLSNGKHQVNISDRNHQETYQTSQTTMSMQLYWYWGNKNSFVPPNKVVLILSNFRLIDAVNSIWSVSKEIGVVTSILFQEIPCILIHFRILCKMLYQLILIVFCFWDFDKLLTVLDPVVDRSKCFFLLN